MLEERLGRELACLSVSAVGAMCVEGEIKIRKGQCGLECVPSFRMFLLR